MQVGNYFFNWIGRKPASLLTVRDRVSSLLEGDLLVAPRPLHGSRLPQREELPKASYQPPRPFSQARALRPIEYLLVETQESPKPRPVPDKAPLLRSLISKGKGTLKQNAQGLIYLDIDNQFILELIPYLQAYNLVRPPYFHLFDAMGAHVPVVPAREAAFHYLDNPPELGREFSFELEGLYSVKPTDWPEMEQVWFFKLHSPELEELRRRHFLTAKPGGHSFHIAVAVKPRVTAHKKQQPLPAMRINVACLAA